MWEYILAFLASLAATETQREPYRARAVAAVCVARASLEEVRAEPPAEEAPEPPPEAPIADSIVPPKAVGTKKNTPAPKCVNGKCSVRVYR